MLSINKNPGKHESHPFAPPQVSQCDEHAEKKKIIIYITGMFDCIVQLYMRLSKIILQLQQHKITKLTVHGRILCYLGHSKRIALKNVINIVKSEHYEYTAVLI